LLAGLAALGSALGSALAHTFVRRATGPRDSRGRPPDAPETVVLAFSVVVVGGALLVGLARGELRGLPPSLPPARALAILLPMALVGMTGQLLLSAAYAHADAPRTAIVGYARIPLGLLADALLWGAVAESSSLLGALLVFAAGWLLIRERRSPRAPLEGPSPPQR
ncbi:MAG: DMT family transporter, partial [Myxococcales bacterium]|nr:DMT family transporter [Myxococcales bacterium]